jgi:hypothetical protein
MIIDPDSDNATITAGRGPATVVVGIIEVRRTADRRRLER